MGVGPPQNGRNVPAEKPQQKPGVDQARVSRNALPHSQLTSLRRCGVGKSMTL